MLVLVKRTTQRMSKRQAGNDANQDSSTKQKIVWMDQREHVIKRPDMYIGSVDVRRSNETVIVRKDGKYACEQIEVECSMALLKFLDEAIVNCIDNQRRDASQKYIKVTILKTGEFTVSNDGSTVPIEKHEDSNAWKPTVVFSEFLSGSNFDDSESRFTGGRNGIGIKATNTWSTSFEVTILNAADKKRFHQIFKNNMSTVGDATVKSYSAKTSITTVKWMPDYVKLGMPTVLESGLDESVMRLLESRVYDICVCVRPSLGVWLNGSKIAIKNLQQYAKVLEIEGNGAHDSVTGQAGDLLFQICITARAENCESQIIGFVNGVKCSIGTHIDMIQRKAAEIILARAKTKSKKSDLTLKPQFLKNELTVVMSTLIPNPRFTSQSKEVLDTPLKHFGFAWEPSASFRSALERSPVIDRIISLAQESEKKQLAKNTKTNRTVPKIHKYDPATALFKKKHCTLILTEGDSAKSLAIAGLSVVGREEYGVFPLRGKFMNVSKFTAKRMMDNAEVSNLMAILGLEFGKIYDETSIQQLPYRRMVIFSDQDIDGSHIAGLLMNFIHTNHRSILNHWPDFIERFATPIVRLTSGPDKIGFFSIQEYQEWKRDNPNSNPKIKYYKGLGTSTSKDAKDYFKNWKNHVTTVRYTGSVCDSAIKTFFDDKASHERKQFLSESYSPDSFVDYSQDATTISEFLCNEMAHFSNSDNVRSIPSAIDGLKPVQRKTLHTFTSKNQVSEIKVAQAGAMVAEYTSYHHGETSVMEAIVGLAQDHVGTNNIAILRPEGQFGSRQNKPSEHAAPRYIFTCLDAITRKIFRSEDDAVLDYVHEDGKSVEPVYFVPVIPMALVNGQIGIGTGWSTSSPNFSPTDLIKRCMQLADVNGATTNASNLESVSPDLTPWYANFKGLIQYIESDSSFRCSGTFHCDHEASTIHVTELPIGTWTEDFLKYVREKLSSSTAKEAESSPERFVKSVNNYSTDTKVDVHLQCFSLPTWDVLDRILKLSTKLSLTNVHLFDKEYKLKHYSPSEIINEHAEVRLDMYAKRRAHLIKEATHQLLVSKNRKRFITEIISDELVVKNMNQEKLNEELESRGFDKILYGAGNSEVASYAYLLKMSIPSMTTDKVTEFEKQLLARAEDLKNAENSTPRAMWKHDLKELDAALEIYYEEKRRIAEYDAPQNSKVTGGSKRGKGRK